MGAFAQADKVFDGDQAERQPENDVDRDQPPQLKPGKCCAVNTKPQRLTNDDVAIGRRVIWKAAVKKIDERQEDTGDCQQAEDKEAPAGPDFWAGLGDKQVKAAPADEDERQR